ncbi:MAG: 2-hydroxyacyl-CoA dehydratase family protein [Candidatus Poseidoniaceae archaeon]|jgi:benzoyl-CoA reductase subunit B|nr:2-hydroxyacyl-CoA dehydratase family protein [Candidatus Poseidoniaceae archaeon]MDP7312414.1 2-hydroxyacyl-CoA dehydratase family protein [Candidatus Thalassarchaeaceae archaeon]
MKEMKDHELWRRGNREGSELFKKWFNNLNEAALAGEHGAYVFVMGSLAEILHSFEMPIIFPEITALQTAVRHEAAELLNEAEDHGYSPDICGYVKADYAIQARGGEHPMGQLPRPGLAILTNACNTYLKWGEMWERMFKTPLFTLDVPGTREHGTQTWQGDEQFEKERKYVLVQIQELIKTCEEVTGRSFDVEKLREAMAYSNRMSAAWKKIIQLNHSRPAVFNAISDGTAYLGVNNVWRGTLEGAEYFERLLEEKQWMHDNGIGTMENEEHRLAFIGVPCYPIFREFSELFTNWGGIFVTSTYMWFASGGNNLGFQYDLEDPLASLAEVTLIHVRDAMDSMFHPHDIVVKNMEEMGIEGVVYHPIKSCRTTSTGLADNRRTLMEMTGLPSLFIESDMMDKRVVSVAQMKNRIDAFFEGMRMRKNSNTVEVLN